jgi:hypothetical protein
MEDTQDAQGSTEGQSEQPTGVSPGLQARIDELVGQREEFRREAAASREQNAEFMREILRLQRGAPAPEPVNPLIEGLDPSDRAKMEAVIDARTKAMLAPMFERLDQIAGVVHTTRAQSALSGIDDPQIRKDASALLEGFRRAGHLDRGIATEDDAILLAKGRAYDRMRKQLEHKEFNDAESPLSGGRAVPVSAGRKPGFDLSKMSPEDIIQNMAEIEKQVGDLEF